MGISMKSADSTVNLQISCKSAVKYADFTVGSVDFVNQKASVSGLSSSMGFPTKDQ